MHTTFIKQGNYGGTIMQKTTYINEENKGDYVEVIDGLVTKVGSNDKIGTWFYSVERNHHNPYFFTSSLEKVLNDFPLELLQEVKIACPNDTMLREIFDNKHSELEREMEHLQMALTVWKW